MEQILQDRSVYELLDKVDGDLAEIVRVGGCVHCGYCKLYRGDYDRKPRGGPLDWDERYSFCCADKGCRKRNTPPSVRFLGRKVYVGVVVVLVSAMMHGLKPERVKRLQQALGIDRKTLESWRKWWIEHFASCPFWKDKHGLFMPRPDAERLPLSLVEAFGASQPEGLLKLMRFLSPVTTGSWKEVVDN